MCWWARRTSGKQSFANTWSRAVLPHWLSPTTTILHFTLCVLSIPDFSDGFWQDLLSFIDFPLGSVRKNTGVDEDRRRINVFIHSWVSLIKSLSGTSVRQSCSVCHSSQPSERHLPVYIRRRWPITGLRIVNGQPPSRPHEHRRRLDNNDSALLWSQRVQMHRGFVKGKPLSTLWFQVLRNITRLMILLWMGYRWAVTGCALLLDLNTWCK